jgi:hypothetical protein
MMFFEHNCHSSDDYIPEEEKRDPVRSEYKKRSAVE